jgi:glyoxylate reductase
MKPKVYITRRIPPPGLELIGEFCDVVLHPYDVPPGEEEIIQNIRDKDGLLCLLTDRINKNIIEAASQLKVISTFSAGFEHIDVNEATKRGIYIGYTPGVLTDATADLVFALILSVSRRIIEADRFVRKLNWKISWSPTLLLGESVWGSIIGIIGLGRIGKAVAKRAKGFNMKVLYTDIARISPEEENGLGVEYRPLEDLLRESDFVSIHTPLTKETYHMIDEKGLRLMKSGAILINTSRGPTVDETALVKALKEKWIGGAGLDVFEREPIGEDNPLLELDNVILLPHIGSATRKTRAKMAEVAASNLLSVLKGESPPYWLNPEVERIRPLSRVRML